MDLPIYNLQISEQENDGAEVSFIALVDQPAIKRDFLAFKETLKVGDPVTVVPGMEHMPTHKGLILKIAEIKDTVVAVQLPDGTIHKWYMLDELAILNDKTLQKFGGPGSGPQGGSGGGGGSQSESIQKANDLVKDAKDVVNGGFVPPELKDAVEIAIDSLQGRAETIKDSKSPEEKEQRIKKMEQDHEKLQGLLDEVVISRRNRVKSSAKFEVVSEDQHIITGPLMVPDQLIYRNSDKFGEHYVKFSADTIKQIAIKFSKKGYQKNVNLMHDAKMQVDGFTMFESFISNEQRGVKPMAAFSDLPNGTWFGTFYVENEDVWQLIKMQQVKGFSVEGLFDYEKPQSKEETALNELKRIFNLVQN